MPGAEVIRAMKVFSSLFILWLVIFDFQKNDLENKDMYK